MDPKRRELVVEEIARLKEEGDVLERDWRRIPWLFATVVLAVPAHFIWGPIAAFYAVLFAPCLVGTAAYLVGVRRAENRASLAELEQAIRVHDARA